MTATEPGTWDADRDVSFLLLQLTIAVEIAATDEQLASALDDVFEARATIDRLAHPSVASWREFHFAHLSSRLDSAPRRFCRHSCRWLAEEGNVESILATLRADGRLSVNDLPGLAPPWLTQAWLRVVEYLGPRIQSSWAADLEQYSHDEQRFALAGALSELAIADEAGIPADFVFAVRRMITNLHDWREESPTDTRQRAWAIGGLDRVIRRFLPNGFSSTIRQLVLFELLFLRDISHRAVVGLTVKLSAGNASSRHIVGKYVKNEVRLDALMIILQRRMSPRDTSRASVGEAMGFLCNLQTATLRSQGLVRLGALVANSTSPEAGEAIGEIGRQAQDILDSPEVDAVDDDIRAGLLLLAVNGGYQAGAFPSLMIAYESALRAGLDSASAVGRLEPLLDGLLAEGLGPESIETESIGILVELSAKLSDSVRSTPEAQACAFNLLRLWGAVRTRASGPLLRSLQAAWKLFIKDLGYGRAELSRFHLGLLLLEDENLMAALHVSYESRREHTWLVLECAGRPLLGTNAPVLRALSRLLAVSPERVADPARLARLARGIISDAESERDGGSWALVVVVYCSFFRNFHSEDVSLPADRARLLSAARSRVEAQGSIDANLWAWVVFLQCELTAASGSLERLDLAYRGYEAIYEAISGEPVGVIDEGLLDQLSFNSTRVSMYRAAVQENSAMALLLYRRLQESPLFARGGTLDEQLSQLSASSAYLSLLCGVVPWDLVRSDVVTLVEEAVRLQASATLHLTPHVGVGLADLIARLMLDGEAQSDPRMTLLEACTETARAGAGGIPLVARRLSDLDLRLAQLSGNVDSVVSAIRKKIAETSRALVANQQLDELFAERSESRALVESIDWLVRAGELQRAVLLLDMIPCRAVRLALAFDHEALDGRFRWSSETWGSLLAHDPGEVAPLGDSECLVRFWFPDGWLRLAAEFSNGDLKLVSLRTSPPARDVIGVDEPAMAEATSVPFQLGRHALCEAVSELLDRPDCAVNSVRTIDLVGRTLL